MIAGWLSKYEGLLLANFAKRANGPIVEIGSFQGKSATAMAKVTNEQIYAVDPHYLGSAAKFRKNTAKYKNIAPVKKTSKEANRTWRRQIALLHIDGNHEYAFAKADLQLWLPHLKDGGVVICHDAFSPEPDVFRAVKEEIFDKGQWKMLGALDSQIFAVKGKPENFRQRIDVGRQKFFLNLAAKIWQKSYILEPVRFFMVNRILKIFFLNRFMTHEILRQPLEN